MLDGGLGVQFLAKRTPILLVNHLGWLLERRGATADPVLRKLIEGFTPGVFPKYTGTVVSSTDELNQAVAAELHRSVDGAGLAEASLVPANN